MDAACPHPADSPAHKAAYTSSPRPPGRAQHSSRAGHMPTPLHTTHTQWRRARARSRRRPAASTCAAARGAAAPNPREKLARARAHAASLPLQPPQLCAPRARAVHAMLPVLPSVHCRPRAFAARGGAPGPPPGPRSQANTQQQQRSIRICVHATHCRQEACRRLAGSGSLKLWKTPLPCGACSAPALRAGTAPAPHCWRALLGPRRIRCNRLVFTTLCLGWTGSFLAAICCAAHGCGRGAQSTRGPSAMQ